MVGMAKTLSCEVAPHGVLINTIAMGYFDTARLSDIIKSRAMDSGVSFENAREDLESAIPLGRIGKPEELAWLVAFLASERASYITGATIQIDGGMFAGIM